MNMQQILVIHGMLSRYYDRHFTFLRGDNGPAVSFSCSTLLMAFLTASLTAREGRLQTSICIILVPTCMSMQFGCQ